MLWFVLFSMLIEPAKMKTPKEVYMQNPIKLVQIMPDTSSNPEDSSLVFIGYTQKALVVYARNYQKGKINATTKKRDAEEINDGEDIFSIILASPQSQCLCTLSLHAYLYRRLVLLVGCMEPRFLYMLWHEQFLFWRCRNLSVQHYFWRSVRLFSQPLQKL